MKKILLMGNPNVGKSAVFSRLTGARVISSNYPGTTVEFTEGTMDVDGEKSALIDVPGKPFHDPQADEALFEVLEKMFRPAANRRLVSLDLEINDPKFADALVAAFREIV